MKKRGIILVSIIFCIVSCGTDKTPTKFGDSDNRVNPQETYTEVEKDFSKDGLEQDLLTVSLPRLSIDNVYNVEMGLEDLNDEMHSIILKEEHRENVMGQLISQQYIRKKILSLMYTKLIEQKNSLSDQILIGDENVYFITEWNDNIYFPVEKRLESGAHFESVDDGSGKIRVSFKLSLHNLKSVKEITNIKISIHLFNPEDKKKHLLFSKILTKKYDQIEHFVVDQQETIVSPVIYELVDHHIDSKLIYNGVLNRSQILVQIDDFDIITKDNKRCSYQQLLSLFKKNHAKIIFSTPQETKIYYAEPNTSLESFLKNNFEEVVLGENNYIITIDDHTNTLETKIDWNNLNREQLDLSIWRFLGGDGEIFEKNKTYVISYATVEDIVRSHSTDKVVFRDFLMEGPVEIKNVYPGDILTFEMTSRKFVPQYKTEERSVECGYDVRDERPEPPIRDVATQKNNASSFPSIKRMVWGEWCGVIHKDHIGYNESTFNFLHELDNMRLRIIIKDKQHKLIDFLFQDHGHSVLNDGRILKLRLKIPQMYGNDFDKVKLVILPDPNAENVEIGFQGWGDCAARFKRGFRFKSYRPETKLHNNAVIEKYIMSVFVNGISY